jgi:hypothetical protein
MQYRDLGIEARMMTFHPDAVFQMVTARRNAAEVAFAKQR